MGVGGSRGIVTLILNLKARDQLHAPAAATPVSIISRAGVGSGPEPVWTVGRNDKWSDPSLNTWPGQHAV
jgi:hypothetical protein